MPQSFPTKCKSCGAEIRMVPTGDKKPDGKDRYLPRNNDGTAHKCTAYTAKEESKVIAGVLKEAHGNGVIIWTHEKGDRTYAVSSGILPPADLPLNIAFRVLPKGFVEITEFAGPATPFVKASEIPRKEPDDRINGPADGECCVDPLVKSPEPKKEPEPEIPYPSRTWSEIPQVTIGITVNLQNFENLRIEVKGAASDRDQLKTYTEETALMFGKKNPPTREMIESYCKRVF